ncbi:MAG: EAL domain-containing protein [Candidatus Faecalibacterium intestinavium]|uniref:EAL domain-containing protein n=1 Tax=Candidatus Faecalibacterium intestinavium TaxID=2838580 RepID=A0A9E2KJR0_9FIRM|nr:EAL domain-containing protein [Candidatus Faecalibacterium intestinavium]
MEKIWDFFENLDEMVYSADVETYQLVYMNRCLREALGIRDHSSYLDQPCYKVLQGRDTPCEFCTNGQLQEGKFYTWVHKNPLLNRRLLLKDSLLHSAGHTYRLEMAIDLDPELRGSSTYFHLREETILKECLWEMFSTAKAADSIQRLMAYMGRTFSCDRAYIFEFKGDTADNTYEWCADHVTPQIDNLKNVPLSSIDWWMAGFREKKITVIPDLEEIRFLHPEAYSILQPQGIHSLAVGPIRAEGQVIGFIGIDNPDPELMAGYEFFLRVIGYIVCNLLWRRDLGDKLRNLSYRDQLTGALNQHALSELYGSDGMESVGIIYCDITGLKMVNEAKGRGAGDDLIRESYETLRRNGGGGRIYRMGDSEFLLLYPDCRALEFYDTLHALQRVIRRDSNHIALGYAWSDIQPLDLEKTVMQAEQVMIRNKREYYHFTSRRPGAVDAPVTQGIKSPETRWEAENYEPANVFQQFVAAAGCDVETVFRSVSQENEASYFYLCDMRRDLAYISDNMRRDFSFPSNLITGLLEKWAERISTQEAQDMFWEDVNTMLRDKRSVHDLRYRVRDAAGNNQFVHCYGIMVWNRDRTEPLFFSGRITHQDSTFVVDPVTGFLREQSSFQQLEEIRRSGQSTLVIGFSLNGITEINSIRGRDYGDRLLQKTANTLSDQLSWKMTFYRLEGARYMALVNPACTEESTETLTEEIRGIIRSCYERMDVSVQRVCSFGVMRYPYENMTPEELIEGLLSLIRVAKREPLLPYVDYATQNFGRFRRLSTMALTLGQDVEREMQNFRVVIQPVVSGRDGSIIGGEVLLRWVFEGQDISPAVFIPILEKHGLIQKVGRWVFGQAAAACVRLRRCNPSLYLTFNVSLHQLNDHLLLPCMEETLEKYGLPEGSLVAEITESAMDEQPQRLEAFITAAHKLGLNIALDDFGSGYSSMRMLLQYPTNIIKLDRSLVTEVTESEAKMHFIQSIVYACHRFGKTVCIEGVEDAEQNEIIRNMGCDVIQGYYYYRPMEIDEFSDTLSRKD